MQSICRTPRGVVVACPCLCHFPRICGDRFRKFRLHRACFRSFRKSWKWGLRNIGITGDCLFDFENAEVLIITIQHCSFGPHLPELPEIRRSFCSCARRDYAACGPVVSGNSGHSGCLIWWRFPDRQGLIIEKCLL